MPPLSPIAASACRAASASASPSRGRWWGGRPSSWEAIDRAVQGTTALVIAHRLSTVLRADRIVVLSRGGVEAVGRHAELLDRSETYRHLHRLQFGDAGALERVR
jgi:ABC-type multidrug transport system ATPase subunit